MRPYLCAVPRKSPETYEVPWFPADHWFRHQSPLAARLVSSQLVSRTRVRQKHTSSQTASRSHLAPSSMRSLSETYRSNAKPLAPSALCGPCCSLQNFVRTFHTPPNLLFESLRPPL